MQVAVAAPHEPQGATLAQQRTKAIECRAARLRQRGGRAGGKQLRFAKGRIILFDEAPERLDPRLGLDHRRFLVRGRDRARERIGERQVDRLPIRQTVEGRVLVEAAHLDRPFDRLAFAGERETAVRLAA